MSDNAPTAAGNAGNGQTAAGMPNNVRQTLEHYAENAYLMLFEDRFTVILDDAGQFQKSFDLMEWLGRFDEDDAALLVALKEKIEARLAEVYE